MCYLHKCLGVLIATLVAVHAFSQRVEKPPTRLVIVRTNLANLVASGPAISVEKIFTKTFSTELSLMQGHFNSVLLTDYYGYGGFLLRAKKFPNGLQYGDVSPYLGIYAGMLKRTIHTKGSDDNSGWFSLPSRDFAGNSLRAGFSLGVSYLDKSRFTFDMQWGIGCGKYIHVIRNSREVRPSGYLDMQLWVSAGYCF